MRLRRKNSVILLSEYFSVLEGKSNEFIEKKSRFIGFCSPIKDEKEALEILEDKRREFKDATHNCWAYILKEDMSLQRYSDDGEPSGTAGIPILEVMKKEGITNALCLVTRYFGGTLLGAGGLVRAYSGAFKKSIEGKVYDYGRFLKYRLTFPYAEFDKIKNHLSHTVYDLDNLEYMENISTDIYIKEEDSEELLETLKNLANRELDYEFEDEYIKAHIDKRIVK